MIFKQSVCIFIIILAVSYSKPVKHEETLRNEEDYDLDIDDIEEPLSDDAPNKAVNDDIRRESAERSRSNKQRTRVLRDKKFSENGENSREGIEQLTQSQPKRRKRPPQQVSDINSHNLNIALKSKFGKENADTNDYSDQEGVALDNINIDMLDNDDFDLENENQDKRITNKKKDKHWYDFYRDRRHVQSKSSSAKETENVNKPGTEEMAIKRHIKQLSTEELELLIKSLSDDKRNLLQEIMEADVTDDKSNNFEAAENSKIAGSEGVNTNDSPSKPDQPQNSIVAAPDINKTPFVDSFNINVNRKKKLADDYESDYDNDNVFESARSEFKRDAVEEESSAYSESLLEPDGEIVTGTDGKEIKKLQKRTADSLKNVQDTLRSLEESFSNHFEKDSETAPLIRVKRNSNKFNGTNDLNVNAALTSDDAVREEFDIEGIDLLRPSFKHIESDFKDNTLKNCTCPVDIGTDYNFGNLYDMKDLHFANRDGLKLASSPENNKDVMLSDLTKNSSPSGLEGGEVIASQRQGTQRYKRIRQALNLNNK